MTQLPLPLPPSKDELQLEPQSDNRKAASSTSTEQKPERRQHIPVCIGNCKICRYCNA